MKSFLDFLKEEIVSSDIAGIDSVVGKEITDKYDIDEVEEDTVFQDALYILTSYYDKSEEDLTKLTQKLIGDFYEVDEVDEVYTIDDLTDVVISLLEEGLDVTDILESMGLPEPEPFESLEDEELEELAGYLETFFQEDEDEDEEYEIEEGVKGMFTSLNFNRKKRKFMKKSKATLRKEKVVRARKNRETRAKRKSYYRQNKSKLLRYTKMYRTAVKKGMHSKKLRRRSGS